MSELTGWLLDVYPAAQDGVRLWLVGQDGQRYHLQQPFPVTFTLPGLLPACASCGAIWRISPLRRPFPASSAATCLPGV